MKVQNKNASAEKTKRKIWKAFLEMHSEGIPGDEMTIKDLARRAEISRSTFYTHYSDLYDLGDQLAEGMMETVFDSPEIHTREDARELYIHLLRAIQNHEKELSMLVRSDYPSAFFQQLQARLKLQFQKCEDKDLFWDVRMGLLIDGTIQQIVAALRRDNTAELEVVFAGLRECLDRLL